MIGTMRLFLDGLRAWIVLVFVGASLLPLSYLFSWLAALIDDQSGRAQQLSSALLWVVTVVLSNLCLGYVFAPIVRRVYSPRELWPKKL
jgi:cyanate permease